VSAPSKFGTGNRTVGPAVSGSWYPDDPVELARYVDELLEAAPDPSEDGSVIALIAPHAGYRYSGQVAAQGFRAVSGRRFRRVIVLGPSHYVGFLGGAVPDADVYRTPLGPVPLDVPALNELCSGANFFFDARAFSREHSVEAELPFLQRVLAPGWKLLPVLTGSRTSGAAAQRLAEELLPLLDSDTLLVVSSDFTHFGQAFGFAPFREDIPAKIRALDLGAVDRIRAWDAEGFEEYVARTGATICGRDAIGVALRLLPRNTRADLAAYDTSGRMTGDWSHTVSYAAIIARAGESYS